MKFVIGLVVLISVISAFIATCLAVGMGAHLLGIYYLSTADNWDATFDLGLSVLIGAVCVLAFIVSLYVIGDLFS